MQKEIFKNKELGNKTLEKEEVIQSLSKELEQVKNFM